MQNENAEHEEKRNNGADNAFPVGGENTKHIAGIGLNVPCGKRGEKDQWRNIKGSRT